MRGFTVRHLLLAAVVSLTATSSSRSVPVSPSTTQHSAAQPSAAQNAIVTMLTQLDNDDPVVRAQARQDLMGLRPDALPALRQAVAAIAPLSPEAELLIHEIVIQIFLSDDSTSGNPDSGFMGIAMGEDQIHSEMDDNAELPVGVLVIGRLPGFASYQMLRDGDVILGLSAGNICEDADSQSTQKPLSKRVRTGEEIKGLVKVLPSGRIVTLTILRSGQRLDVSFKLGARPLELETMGAEYSDYRQDQQRRADSYWQANFADLVDRSYS